MIVIILCLQLVSKYNVENGTFPQNNTVGKSDGGYGNYENGKNNDKKISGNVDNDKRDSNNEVKDGKKDSNNENQNKIDKDDIQVIIIATSSVVVFCVLLVTGIIVYKHKRR